MPDHRLHQQPGQRRGHPQHRQTFDPAAQRLEHPAHIGVLQRKTDLDAEKADAEATQAEKGPARLFHICPLLRGRPVLTGDCHRPGP
jgi:malonyl CoA-acyl carrier protein transacylase